MTTAPTSMWRFLARLLRRTPTAASPAAAPPAAPSSARPSLAERIAQGRALAAQDARALAARRAADDAQRARDLAEARRAATLARLGIRRAPAPSAPALDDENPERHVPLRVVPGVADRQRLTPLYGSEIIKGRGPRALLFALMACVWPALGPLAGAPLAAQAPVAAPVAAPAAAVPNAPQAAVAAGASTIKDLTIAEGAAPYRLTGYGIVVGLDGTGDRGLGAGMGARAGSMTVQSVVNLLRNFSVEIPPELVRTRNAAVVLVTAEVSPYLRAGGRFEVHVSSLGDARSLRGGVLYMTPLVAEAGGRPVAVAQGTLLLSEVGDTRSRYGAPPVPETTARLPQGGQLEADLPRPTFAGATRLLLKEPDVTTASRIAQAINAALGPNSAKVEDPGAVALALADSADRAATLGRIVALRVQPDRVARLVIDARDGTVVAGGDLVVGAAVVSHGGTTLTIGGDVGAANDSTGAPGDVRIAPGTSVQRVAAALHAVQTPASEIAAIFAALREVGALAAEVVVR